jgi:hypothetical protein
MARLSKYAQLLLFHSAVCLCATASLFGQTIVTAAGNGTRGYSGDGGPATAAELNTPALITPDAAGDVYFADLENNVIRKLSAASGIITTVAGDGVLGFGGDGGPATSAELNYPSDIAFDPAGNLYIADQFNYAVRKVDAATGIISTVAGRGNCGSSYCGDGGPATEAELNVPNAVLVDVAGDLYISDSCNNVVRKVEAASGIINTAVGNGYGAGAGCPAPTGGYSGDGGPATSAEMYEPYGLAFDSAGDLYIADGVNNVIRKVSAGTGIITTVAGNGFDAGTFNGGYSGDNGPATAAEMYWPNAVAFDAAGNLYISDEQNNRIRMVSAATGIVTTVVGDGVQGYSGDGGPATSAELYNPTGIAFNGAGDLYLSDEQNFRIREVLGLGPAHPTQTTLASDANPQTYGQSVTFTATITPVPAETQAMTGSVQFFDGANLLGTESVSSSRTAALTTASLAAGSHNICGVYSGDSYYAGSTGCMTETIEQAVLTVSADDKTMPQGGPLPALTASYNGFVNGDTFATCCTGAPALSTTATASSPPGAYPIDISQGTLAAANYTFTFVNGTLDVLAATFSLSATPATQTVTGGGAASYTIALTSENNFAGTVALSCAGAPSDAACTFAQSSLTLTAGGTAQTTMTVATTAADAALRGLEGFATETQRHHGDADKETQRHIRFAQCRLRDKGTHSLRSVQAPGQRDTFASLSAGSETTGHVRFARWRLREKGDWPLMGLCLPLAGLGLKRRRLRALALLLLALLLLGAGFSGCGSSHNGSSSQKSYAIKITATGNSVTQSTSLNLVVD